MFHERRHVSALPPGDFGFYLCGWTGPDGRWFPCMTVHGTELRDCFHDRALFLTIFYTSVIVFTATPILLCLLWRSDIFFVWKRC
jgi:hypothetical protein